jgi:uracil-DNA glycosylase
MTDPLDGVDVTSLRRHPLAKCEQCPFFTDEFGYVPSYGPDKAELALVGQNPGANEIRLGRPFIGPSGRLLDKVLEHYRIDRSKALVTNACSCTHRTDTSIKPPATAVAACRPRLIAELRERGVKDVVAMGNVPAQDLLLTRTVISTLRIGPHRENPSELPGVRIIPTFHPAACLRSSASFPSMANDFGKLVTHPPKWEPPYYVVFKKVKAAIMALESFKRRGIKRFAVDIETDLDKEVSFDHPNKYKILCIGMAWSRHHAVVFAREVCRTLEFRRALDVFLSGDDMELIFQNGKFDTAGLYAKSVRGLRIWHDTMYQSYVMDERPGIHGLKYQGVEKLGTPRWDEEIERYLGRGKQRRYGFIPKKVLYRYNAWDVAATFGLDEHNMALIQNDDWMEPIRPRADGERWGLVRLHEFLCDAATNFMFTEYNGFAVDLRYNRVLQREYQAEIDRLERIMTRIVGPINPRSPLQVKDALRELGVSIPKARNMKGELVETTNAEALAFMIDRAKRRGGANADRVITFLETMQQHRKVSKLDGTYVSGLRKYVDRGRVYPTIQIHSTSTGRLSQKKPSLQVIPRGDTLRRQYCVSDPEHLLGEFDYGQIELRVLTWLAQEPYFRDIFCDATRDLFDELEPVIQPERSSRQIMSKKDRRNIVKCYVYGLAYGREAQSIADEFGLPLSEAQRGLRAFFKVIPNIVKFREEAKYQALSGRDLVTPFGRRRRFYLITDQNRKDIANEACAFYPQSIASDICVSAFVELRPKLKGIAWCRNTVHDALYWEFHRDNAEYVVDTVRQTMRNAAYRIMGDYVPIKVGADVGLNWGDLISWEDWQQGKRPYPTTVALRSA